MWNLQRNMLTSYMDVNFHKYSNISFITFVYTVFISSKNHIQVLNGSSNAGAALVKTITSFKNLICFESKKWHVWILRNFLSSWKWFTKFSIFNITKRPTVTALQNALKWSLYWRHVCFLKSLCRCWIASAKARAKTLFGHLKNRTHSPPKIYSVYRRPSI